jgi:DNA polymerase elongation subunit (family B)
VIKAVSAWTSKDKVYVQRPDMSVTAFAAEYAGFVKNDFDHTDDYRIIDVRQDYSGWRKLVFKDYDSRKSFVNGYAGLVYEGDVSPVARILADKDIQICKPRRLYIDIETDSRVTVQDAIDGYAGVLLIAAKDEAGQRFQWIRRDESDEAERDGFEWLWELMSGYVQICGWNSDGFDELVLKERAKQRFGMYMDRRLQWLDQMVAFRRMNLQTAQSGEEKQSFALGSFAQSIIGEGKHDFDTSLTYEAWKAGDKRLAEYNMQDVELLPKLEAALGYLETFQTICETVHRFPSSHALKPTQQVDGYLLRMAREEKTHLPSAVERDLQTQFDGAFVMKPSSRGIHKDVAVLDFSSLYPSCFQTFNLSFDTKYVEGKPFCTAPSGYRSRTDVRGMIPRLLDRCIELRKDWKAKKAAATPGTPEWLDAERRQNVFKVLSNSVYGLHGNSYSRYYDRGIAEACTNAGVWALKTTIAEVERRGIPLIYGDTDSVYIKDVDTGELARYMNKEEFPRLLKERGCVDNKLNLEWQEVFERIIFPLGDDGEPVSKRYVGRFKLYQGKPVDELKIEVKGLAYKRGDSSRLTRQMQKEIVDMLMAGCEDAEVFEKHVLQWQHKILEEELDIADVAISKGVKELAAYKQRKTMPANVRIAEQQRAKGLNPFKVTYVVTNGSTSPMEIASIEDCNGEFDRSYVWRSVYPESLRLLAGAFADRNWNKFLGKKPKYVAKEQLKLFT